MRTYIALGILLIARGLSASHNLVHDCDEVFNYWEPLHYLLYGYGFQTWEYRCEEDDRRSCFATASI